MFHNVRFRAIKMLAKREDIDLERELHMVYKMFCTNQAKLIAMKGVLIGNNI